MTPEQKQRIAHEISNWRNARNDHSSQITGDRMSALLQELINAPAEVLTTTNQAKTSSSQVEAPEPEPFGYFKAEPFGWTDCAETDDGAIALFAAPPAPRVPVEPMENIALNEWFDKTEWVQKEINTFPVSSLGMHRADVMRLEIERLRKLLSAAPTPAEAPADVARDAELLRKLRHSIRQAMIPGNDWRRELALMNGAIDAAMSEKGQS